MCETKKKFTGSYTEVNPIRCIKNNFLAAGKRGCTAVQFVFLQRGWKDTIECANTKKINWLDPKYTGTLQKSDCHKARNFVLDSFKADEELDAVFLKNPTSLYHTLRY